MTEWQPTSTAPESSVPILAISNYGLMSIETGYYLINMRNEPKLAWTFTHWMPLPPPPEEQK